MRLSLPHDGDSQAVRKTAGFSARSESLGSRRGPAAPAIGAWPIAIYFVDPLNAKRENRVDRREHDLGKLRKPPNFLKKTTNLEFLCAFPNQPPESSADNSTPSTAVSGDLSRPHDGLTAVESPHARPGISALDHEKKLVFALLHLQTRVACPPGPRDDSTKGDTSSMDGIGILDGMARDAPLRDSLFASSSASFHLERAISQK